MSARLAGLGVVVAGLLGFGAYSLASSSDESVAPEGQPVVEREDIAPEPSPIKATATAPEPEPEAEDRKDALVLPDGSTVPLLNNCKGRVDIMRGWGNNPWSPIVAKQIDDHGWEWYLHEDGTYTQTRLVFRKDLGKYEPLLQVARPKAPAPIAPEDLEQAAKQRKAAAGK